jgi:excisionase family DNA binding protein
MPLAIAPTTAHAQQSNESTSDLIELMTVADVAALLKVSRSWVYEHTRARDKPRSARLPHVKIGKYVRFDPHLVRAFLDRQTAR